MTATQIQTGASWGSNSFTSLIHSRIYGSFCRSIFKYRIMSSSTDRLRAMISAADAGDTCEKAATVVDCMPSGVCFPDEVRSRILQFLCPFASLPCRLRMCGRNLICKDRDDREGTDFIARDLRSTQNPENSLDIARSDATSSTVDEDRLLLRRLIVTLSADLERLISKSLARHPFTIDAEYHIWPIHTNEVCEKTATKGNTRVEDESEQGQKIGTDEFEGQGVHHDQEGANCAARGTAATDKNIADNPEGHHQSVGAEKGTCFQQDEAVPGGAALVEVAESPSRFLDFSRSVPTLANRVNKICSDIQKWDLYGPPRQEPEAVSEDGVPQIDGTTRSTCRMHDQHLPKLVLKTECPVLLVLARASGKVSRGLRRATTRRVTDLCAAIIQIFSNTEKDASVAGA
ncbi:unnamed protein product [Amoebophrya sp. A25]|nr:unnamed protein product [Amoebophrya sp. A25]|eukprot:GSA25T00005697001.1